VESTLSDTEPSQAEPSRTQAPEIAAPEMQVESLSPQYSQLCGILAGFAFVGFSIYLAREKLPLQAANVTASLFAAFVTLILLAVLYALMAADRSANRVATGIYVYGLPFGLSSITLFYTLTLMALERPQLHETVQIGRIFVLIVGPAIVVARMNGGARMLKAGRASRILPRRLGLTLVSLLVAEGVALMIWPHLSNGVRGHGVVPAYIALGSAVVAGALSPLIADRPDSSTLHRISIDIYLLIGFLALAASTFLASAALR
jgi:hypothetical protein